MHRLFISKSGCEQASTSKCAVIGIDTDSDTDSDPDNYYRKKYLREPQVPLAEALEANFEHLQVPRHQRCEADRVN